MIAGVVNTALEAVLPLTVVGPAGRQQVEATIDTGFNGSLTLPIAVATALSLSPLTPMAVTLADASQKSVARFGAAVLWDGRLRSVKIVCVEGTPLVGTALLRGYEMVAEFAAGGKVVLRKMP